MKKEKLVRAIAKDLYLREDIVEEVLDRFLDIAVEEIANTGEFRFHRFFNVSGVRYEAYQGGKGFVPAHTRLKVRLSSGLHRLFKLKDRSNSLEINRDNWKQVLASAEMPKITGQKPLDKGKEDPLYNPLLDDD